MANSADHGARDHATWSASSTARNWTCSGAIALNSRVKTPERESEASAWGTACHQLSEKCLRGDKDADAFIGTIETTKQRKIEVTEELAETAQVYIDYVREGGVQSFVEHGWLALEQHFTLNDLKTPFDAGGTGDAVVYYKEQKRIEVVDLKGGRGLVEAADNKQLRTYGLGAVLANPGIDVETVTVTIVQPRASHKSGKIRSETFHIADLVEWTADLIARMKLSKQAIDEMSTTPFAAWSAKWLTPGNCKFCPSEGNCPALDEKALNAAGVWFDNLDQPQISNSPAADEPAALARTLDLLDMIQDWIAAKRAFAHQQAEAGAKIEDPESGAVYILVPKVGREKWEEGAEDKVRDACHGVNMQAEKYLNPAKLKTPKQIRKALGKKHEALVAGLSVTPSEGTNLVRQDRTTRSAVPSTADKFFNVESE